MIDINIHPSQLDQAKSDIRDIISNHNRYNKYDMIVLRDCEGRFMPMHQWLYVIDNTDRINGEYFIRMEFDDSHKIVDQLVDHFGGFNVGY